MTKHLLQAKTHQITRRRFGPNDTPSIQGHFDCMSLHNKSDRQNLRRFANAILKELARTS